jgi:hypothetical protein
MTMSTATSRWRTCIGRELSHIQRYPVRGAPDGSAARNSRECAAPSGGDREAAAGHCESIPHERTRQRSLTLRNVRAPEHRSDAHPLGTRELLWRPTPRTLALGGQAGATPAISRSIETRPEQASDVSSTRRSHVAQSTTLGGLRYRPAQLRDCLRRDAPRVRSLHRRPCAIAA